MCGIVGYVGTTPKDVLISGIKKLEYRGYDSAGIAILDKKIEIHKQSGKLERLENFLSNFLFPTDVCGGIAHTRWATHGKPSEINAHPHTSKNGKFAIVHNGIIENFEIVKKELLQKGYKFSSQTDSEIIAHLLEENYANNNIFAAIKNTFSILKGSYAVGILCEDFPKTVFAIKSGSPLIVGKGNTCTMLASDIPALVSVCNDYTVLDNDEIAILKQNDVSFVDINGKILEKKFKPLTLVEDEISKCGYKTFMQKEINEIPKILEKTLQFYQGNSICKQIKKYVKNVGAFYFIGCGTAFHAALYGAKLFSEQLNIKCFACLASEFAYSKIPLDKNDVCVFISQSGETADTLAGLLYAKKYNAKTIAICNSPSSTIAREANFNFPTFAGIEIAVASTKAYVCQLLTIYIMMHCAKSGKICKSAMIKLNDLIKKCYLVENLNLSKAPKAILSSGNVFFVGRSYDYYTCQEASLKLKEITYINCNAYAGGELKHGPLSLIDRNACVIVIATNKQLCSKVENLISEIKSRGGKVIVFSQQKLFKKVCDEFYFLPTVETCLMPMLSVIPQFNLALNVCEIKGLPADKPRNLAKSVTVE